MSFFYFQNFGVNSSGWFTCRYVLFFVGFTFVFGHIKPLATFGLVFFILLNHRTQLGLKTIRLIVIRRFVVLIFARFPIIFMELFH
uniref:Putative secreted peptide n=1 Tax=Anopheles braziliensis TaxID=58242 RepID=A0A2M3ZS85_9DIPT